MLSFCIFLCVSLQNTFSPSHFKGVQVGSLLYVVCSWLSVLDDTSGLQE